MSPVKIQQVRFDAGLRGGGRHGGTMADVDRRAAAVRADLRLRRINTRGRNQHASHIQVGRRKTQFAPESVRLAMTGPHRV